MAGVTGSLPPVRETCTEFRAPAFCPAKSWLSQALGE